MLNKSLQRNVVERFIIIGYDPYIITICNELLQKHLAEKESNTADISDNVECEALCKKVLLVGQYRIPDKCFSPWAL